MDTTIGYRLTVPRRVGVRVKNRAYGPVRRHRSSVPLWIYLAFLSLALCTALIVYFTSLILLA